MMLNMPLGNFVVNANLPSGHGHILPVGKCAGMDNRLRELRRDKGWTQGELAERAGVDTSYISRLETGKRGKGRGGKSGPTYNIIRSIADALGVAVEDLGSVDGASSALEEDASFLIPLYAKISAGTFMAQDGVREADIERHIKVSHLPKGDWFALTVDGTSMNRVAPNGSIIIVNRADDRLVDGAFYVFSLDNRETTFKRFKREPEPTLMPFSWDPDHASLSVGEKDLYVFGRVRRVITDL